MKKFNDKEMLFNQPGYVQLGDYVKDMDTMIFGSEWKIPLPHRDRFLLFIARILSHSQWFSSAFYFKNPFMWSPAFATLLAYLKREKIIDLCYERRVGQSGYFAYTIFKHLDATNTKKILHANGVAQSRSVALSKAIGEIVERTVAGKGDENRNVVYSSVSKLRIRGKVFYPPEHHRFLQVQKDQFPALNFTEQKLQNWVMGFDLHNGEHVFIPRHLTSWFYAKNGENEIFVNPTTNGSALAFTKEDAALRGLLEVVERDAYFTHWLTKTAPSIFDLDTLPLDIKDSIDSYRERGITLHVLNTTTNVPIPSVCVVAISREAEVPGVVVSASSALSFGAAIRSALREMIICAQSLNEEILPCADVEPFVSSLNKSTRPSYWRGRERLSECEWFISGEKVSFVALEKKYASMIQERGTEKENLKQCVAILQKLGKNYFPTVYYPKSRLANNLGCVVAQVFIPMMFPLYLEEKYGTFDSDRLSEFAQYKGKDNWKINSVPHMFV